MRSNYAHRHLRFRRESEMPVALPCSLFYIMITDTTPLTLYTLKVRWIIAKEYAQTMSNVKFLSIVSFVFLSIRIQHFLDFSCSCSWCREPRCNAPTPKHLHFSFQFHYKFCNRQKTQRPQNSCRNSIIRIVHMLKRTQQIFNLYYSV